VQVHVFCPKALACIGPQPDTVVDRSIIIPMQRAKRGENVAEFRRRTLGNIAALAEEVRGWAAANKPCVAEAYHQNAIDFLSGREADIWESLFAIIRVAAPERIDELKATAIRLVAEKAEHETDSQLPVCRPSAQHAMFRPNQQHFRIVTPFRTFDLEGQF
jgi:hypothetical protein